MFLNDAGIWLEIFGFILLLLTASRNPSQGVMLLNVHKESPFDTFRKKIISDEYVYWGLGFGIGLVILGLIFQLSHFIS